MTIGILDLDVGNLKSLESAFSKININYTICKRSSDLLRIEKLVIPGVGAFNDFMKKMQSSKIDKIIIDKVKKKIPILGVCVGFQVLFQSSTEHGINKGLCILEGELDNFKTINKSIKVPHVGWNSCKYIKNSPLYNNIKDNSDFYFTHSYYLKNFKKDYLLSETNYHTNFISSVAIDNIYAVQFHPEKSQNNGLQLLKNFSENC